MKLTLPKLLFILFSTFYILSPAIARADEISLVVSPPRIDLEGKPGDILQKSVKVTNNSSVKDLILQVSVADFIVQDDLGTPIKVTESVAGKYLASPWFTLEKSEIVLKPKESTSIVVLITVPATALPGGHYAGIFFEPVPSRNYKKTVSYVASEVGSLFGINIAGEIKYDAIIKDFKVESNVAEFGPINFSTTIENQSDTHIRPVATITVHNMIGAKLEEISLDELNIFPYSSRTLKGTWDTIWGLGRYTATIQATYGPGLVASRTLYFWIMPYRLIATILVVLMVSLAIFISVRRHLKHREDHRDDEIDELKRKIAQMENNHH